MASRPLTLILFGNIQGIVKTFYKVFLGPYKSLPFARIIFMIAHNHYEHLTVFDRKVVSFTGVVPKVANPKVAKSLREKKLATIGTTPV